MFKDSFKAANDNIHADEELVNKVLALKNPEKQIQLRRKKRFVSYIPAAAAAVIIVCGTAVSIPYLTKPHSDDGVIYTASSETTSPNTDNALPPPYRKTAVSSRQMPQTYLLFRLSRARRRTVPKNP